MWILLQERKGRFGYVDTGGGKIIGDKKLECVMTLLRGEVVFDPSGLSMPVWQDIPKDSKYWAPLRQKW